MREILFLLFFLLVACTDRAPSEAIVLPEDQLPSIIRDANTGDLISIKRLIAHYAISPENRAAAEEWRAKARSLGDPDELYYHAAELFIEAKREHIAVKRRILLTTALKSARHSYESDRDKATLRLIDEILVAIDAMQ